MEVRDGREVTDSEVRASSSRVRIILVAFASREFSMSSLTIDGMSRINCPLAIFWIVVVESLVIIFKSKSNSKKQSKAMECCLGWICGCT